MKTRTRLILESGVEDHIKTGEPITSYGLYRDYDFGIKPAMIRWELNDLDEAGYLMQIHHSSGRLPTNKAYKFFVDKTLKNLEQKIDEKVLGTAEDFLEDLFNEPESFAEKQADYLDLLSVVYEPEDNRIYESGLKNLLSNLEVQTKEDFMDVIRDFESLANRLENTRSWWRYENFWPQVFIGSNPVTKSQKLSVIADHLEAEGRDLIIMAIGPKRMDYQKSLKLFKSLEKVI